MFASGPLADGEWAADRRRLDDFTGGKLPTEARELAEADPFVKSGLRKYELKEWTVMEGSLGLRVNLSDQSVEVA